MRQSFCISELKELMKQVSALWFSVLVLATTLTSCEVVGGIFKAGFVTAIILVVLVVVLILWLVRRRR
jgi:hypothetical protein